MTECGLPGIISSLPTGHCALPLLTRFTSEVVFSHDFAQTLRNRKDLLSSRWNFFYKNHFTL